MINDLNILYKELNYSLYGNKEFTLPKTYRFIVTSSGNLGIEKKDCYYYISTRHNPAKKQILLSDDLAYLLVTKFPTDGETTNGRNSLYCAEFNIDELAAFIVEVRKSKLNKI